MKKKRLIIIGILILVIIAIVVSLIIYFSNRAKYVFDVEYVSNIEYSTVRIDDKYGVIDGNGNITNIQRNTNSESVKTCICVYV